MQNSKKPKPSPSLNFSGITSRLIITTLILLKGNLSYADDTEIFINRAKSDVNPNVFFVLDNSTSMNWCLNTDSVPHKKTGCPRTKNFETRLSILKTTLDRLLVEMKDVNIGIMSMHKREEIALPISDIEIVRETARKKVKNLVTDHYTPTAETLFYAARYLTAIPKKHDAIPALTSQQPSPIKQACQSTHMVFLTDGEPLNKKDPTAAIKTFLDKKTCSQNPHLSGTKCIYDLVQWLNETDQAPDPLKDQQSVTTHTIGFALDSLADKHKAKKLTGFLKELAEKGGGESYTADNATELTRALESIMQHAVDIESASFVTPSAAPSHSVQSTDQLYYALFKPSTHNRWNGNLKRYELALNKNAAQQPTANSQQPTANSQLF